MKPLLDWESWPEPYRTQGRRTADLATAVYAGHVRDQGSPYLEHPARVVAILHEEFGVTDPHILILGLLHDALEVSPESEPAISAGLGANFVRQLRAMTPDHRLELRPKRPEDACVWHEKLNKLDASEILVRLADRVDNLRDLSNSPSLQRRSRFLDALTETYIPLSAQARDLSPSHRRAHQFLTEEHQRVTGAGII
ncbi:HD domain-containing protein [Streptomyces sp. TRM66268-LWL]|uniref:HD domain-containing protein n=1 Tax=Streptomyces polyasparticus TaxID=2767826 RepID=A0ABR7SQQ1_9ACTN|nr:HD domain-containing protein [Streptomyces polyasparticus]MBC9717825.1 HD domain-containing protein [Streptomyces polyasparticus]